MTAFAHRGALPSQSFSHMMVIYTMENLQDSLLWEIRFTKPVGTLKLSPALSLGGIVVPL